MLSLGGAYACLNSETLSPVGLRGQVVLVDFWTLTGINWLRTEPYVRAWSQAYRDDKGQPLSKQFRHGQDRSMINCRQAVGVRLRCGAGPPRPGRRCTSRRPSVGRERCVRPTRPPESPKRRHSATATQRRAGDDRAPSRAANAAVPPLRLSPARARATAGRRQPAGGWATASPPPTHPLRCRPGSHLRQGLWLPLAPGR
jgi:hypothetical protein